MSNKIQKLTLLKYGIILSIPVLTLNFQELVPLRKKPAEILKKKSNGYYLGGNNEANCFVIRKLKIHIRPMQRLSRLAFFSPASTTSHFLPVINQVKRYYTTTQPQTV
jgi:hypothetical protein